MVVSHSPVLLAMPDAEILSFDRGPIHPCAYEETDSYQVTAMFINHRQQLLHRLLEEPADEGTDGGALPRTPPGC